MSQLPIDHEPRLAEEWVSYLADILMKEERIVSNVQPFSLSRDLAEEWFNDNYADELETKHLASAWSEKPALYDESEGYTEPEVLFIAQGLELYKKSTENMILMLCANCPDSEVVEQLSKWGPEQ
jgi:hypothetical protein